MRFLKAGETPTIDMIRKDLGDNPPGTPIMSLHMEYAYNSTFYIPFLLKRLERAERPCWRKALDAIRELVRRRPQNDRVTHELAVDHGTPPPFPGTA